MLIKITCNNCGDVTVFDKDYMSPKRKRCFDCYKCRNNNKEHNERKHFLKKYNNHIYDDFKNHIYDNFDFNKYFGRHKGFIFENITEDEFEKMMEKQNEKIKIEKMG